ncbi:hypothetical protein T08_15199 [Trichinella sp. T8]|nr:hypothetical protein T08_15199 [Trichinella sp. T8]
MVQGCRCRLAAGGVLRSWPALAYGCSSLGLSCSHIACMCYSIVHKLSHHALFLYRKFDGLRETIRPASQDDSFDGIRRESCFELLQQDLVGCSTHPAKRLQEQPAQVTSVHTDVLAEKIQRRNAPGRCAS